jgi:hypothetical protein
MVGVLERTIGVLRIVEVAEFSGDSLLVLHLDFLFDTLLYIQSLLSI